jgi:hypothetical protein
MRFGYSMMVREFVEAREVEYGDCEEFQIVCPCCREPVHKRIRSYGEEQTHFLAHYRSKSADDDQCELRVSSMTPGDYESWNAESRGQAVEKFLGVFREALLDTHGVAVSGDREELRRAVMRLTSRPSIKVVTDFAREGLVAFADGFETEGEIRKMMDAWTDFRHRSPFWCRRQAGYAADMVAHLLTPVAEPNLRFLVAVAVVNLSRSFPALREHEQSVGAEWPPGAVAAFLEAFWKGKSVGTLQQLVASLSGARKARTQAEAQARIFVMAAGIRSMLVGPVVGLLCGVPYSDLAKGRRVEPHDPGFAQASTLLEEFLEAIRSLRDAPAP